MRARALLIPAICAAALAAAGCHGDEQPQSSGPRSARTSPTHAVGGVSTRARRLPRARPADTYRGPVPILMYHAIGSPPPGNPYPELYTSSPLFVQQVRALRSAGYRAVTLDEVWRAWHGGPGMPRHPVVLSFDDGYRGQATQAARTLRTVGWTGVLNLEVNRLGAADGLTPGEVRAMIRAGWEVDAHTIDHPDLTTVAPAELHTEVAGSRSAIRHAFDVPVNFFCYPSGRYDAEVEAAVQSAGFEGATTTEPGLARRTDDPFALPRIRVDGGESPSTLLAQVASTP
jgi:peptidoglycan/xylan/chitin deacetylase (PgdA/CDA1 family)